MVQWPLKSDCLSNELIISKLNEYGFSLFARKLMQSYFTERKQRTKINYTYSSYKEILFGVPQCSILGTILFNIFTCDLFLVVQNADLQVMPITTLFIMQVII